MRGRKPKSVEMKLLAGNPGQRPLTQSTSAPFVQAPLEKPDWLDEYASKEWDHLVSTLAPILSPASAGMVLIAAQAYSEMRRMSEILAREGETYQTTSREGQEFFRQRPEVAILANARRHYHQALAELGASPVAHTRVRALPPEQTELPGIRRLLG